MKYALISDIHSNLPALEAVLADIDGREDVRAVYYLGDLAGYAPCPTRRLPYYETGAFPASRATTTQRWLTTTSTADVRSTVGGREKLAHLSYEWTRSYVPPETKRDLGGLPFRMDLRPMGGHKSYPQIILVHGTPTLNTLYCTKDRSDSFCTKMTRAAGAKEGDLIAFGHTHKPWHREVEDIRFLNTGSVGKPKDGDWRAGCVLW